MSILKLKLSVGFLLITCTCLFSTDIDSTYKKFGIELDARYLVGTTPFIDQECVTSKHYQYALGLNMNYAIKPSHKIKLGLAVNYSGFDYRIIKRDLLTSMGELFDREDYKEITKLKRGTVELSYATLIAPKSWLEFGVMGFKVLNEAKERISESYESSEIVFAGIDHSTNGYNFGFNAKYKYELSSHFDIGFIIQFSNENIRNYEIYEETKNNSFVGTGVSFKL